MYSTSIGSSLWPTRETGAIGCSSGLISPYSLRMPPVSRLQSKKQNLAGVMRISPEGTKGTWYVTIS